MDFLEMVHGSAAETVCLREDLKDASHFIVEA